MPESESTEEEISVDGFEMGDSISLDSLLGVEATVEPTTEPNVEDTAEANVETPAEPIAEVGFVKGEAISLDELVNEVEAEESADAKEAKEEEPTVTDSDDSDEDEEPTPTINLFANMFGGWV